MERIRELRKKRGLTQEMLADALGVAQQTISRIEANPHSMPVDILVNLANYFNVSSDYILERTDQKHNDCTLGRVAHYMEKYGDMVMDYDKLTAKNQVVVCKLIDVLLENQSEN